MTRVSYLGRALSVLPFENFTRVLCAKSFSYPQVKLFLIAFGRFDYVFLRGRFCGANSYINKKSSTFAANESNLSSSV